jgi:hypothetical protein
MKPENVEGAAILDESLISIGIAMAAGLLFKSSIYASRRCALGGRAFSQTS